MAAIINNPEPIDQRDPAYDELLSQLQGNILKGHGREETMNIFVRFDKDHVPDAKKWLSEFAKETLTSMKAQLRETEVFKRNKISGGLFAGIYFTAEGYRYLGYNPVGKFTDKPFVEGMQKQPLNDPPVREWDRGFRGGEWNEIHAMILLADQDQERMCAHAKEITEAIDAFGKIITIEYGHAIKNAAGDGIEHFGYVDGVSQPLFFTDEIDAFKKNNFGGHSHFNPWAPLDLVLVKDPFVTDEDAYGSYFVFRKLEENVREFKKAEEKLGKDLEKEANLAGLDFDPERAGAMLVGRFEDGTPVVLSKEDKMIGSGVANNFNYDSDKDGLKCPFHAHIRKTNPRGSGGFEPPEDEKKHIMARRGITYGIRQVNPEFEQSLAQMPTEGVGLLFMSFQKSIENQFQFIQINWANNAGFPKLPPGAPAIKPGIDAIIGQVDPTTPKPHLSHGHYAVDYGNGPLLPKSFSFELFVTMKGGEYFFAPSIPFLKSL
ncbi:hypothetical protein QNI19_17725 [Cytophagaceae bacterium DM2B3-1]|uniref:DyP dimeric alpha+beta barrel domain-containing protein n=1 Tax=Xanthocytophaga flava TaxID=3048013 RepID=A0ABT7CM12_9BACT|nr:hypothetical protein [Xanthocytophaga flavus]MDJ1494783.1 hypothetical protein [Xanthocytophaga flavus]